MFIEGSKLLQMYMFSGVKGVWACSGGVYKSSISSDPHVILVVVLAEALVEQCRGGVALCHLAAS